MRVQAGKALGQQPEFVAFVAAQAFGRFLDEQIQESIVFTLRGIHLRVLSRFDIHFDVEHFTHL